MNVLQAERSVIGCMLMYQKETETVYRRLSPKMFSEQPLQVLFNCCMKLHKRDIPVDAVTVVSKIGEEYTGLIAECAETVPDVGHFDFYVEAVLDAWRVREMKAAALELATADLGCGEMMQMFADVVSRQQIIQNTVEERTAKDFAEGVLEFIKNLQMEDTSIKSGWEALDRVTGGLQRKAVYVIAARPGKGKTDWALQLATKISLRRRVVYHTLEMSTDQMMQRIASRACRLDSTRIRDKRLTEEEQRHVLRAMNLLANNSKLLFDEAEKITPDLIEERILKYRPDIVFIDHLGLMDVTGSKNQWEAVAENCHMLKNMARRHNVAIVELVQKHRRTDTGKTTMGDLYGGSSVEQDADGIFSLDVEEREGFLTGDDSLEVTVEILKNRHGGTGDLKFAWQPQYHNYTPIDTER